MSIPNNVPILQNFDMLKHLLAEFTAMVDPYLEATSLADLRVDASLFDLKEETERGGAHYMPMSQKRLDSLDKQPCKELLFECPRREDAPTWRPWWKLDAMMVQSGLQQQLFEAEDQENGCCALDTTQWQLRAPRSRYDSTLREYPWGKEPKKQFEWELQEVFEAEHHPHRACISLHEVPDVTGLLRSEMMIITAMMLGRMDRQDREEHSVFPLLMVSIIGRDARVIQAHVCPVDGRLKICYSQLLDFTDCQQAQMDLFVRWLLSEPVSETNATDDAEDADVGPAGTAAPQIIVFEEGKRMSPRTTRSCHDLLKASGGMPNRATVMVA